jgi:AcrR family transcriptional regulator
MPIGDREPGRAVGAGTEPGSQTSVWDLPERGTRGPKPRHGRPAVAAAAVRIADTEGLSALTMRRVASELGMATMSLYNYVPAKDHLSQLMIDHLAGEYAYPPELPADPRSGVADLARQARDIARRHPWLPELLHRPVPPGPNGLRYLDYFLGLLAGSPLDTGAKLEVIAMISGFATMYGGMQAALASQRAGSGASAEEQAAAQMQAFARAAASGRYPNLTAALTTAGPARGEDDIFESCIQRLIDAVGPTAPKIVD